MQYGCSPWETSECCPSKALLEMLQTMTPCLKMGKKPRKDFCEDLRDFTADFFFFLNPCYSCHSLKNKIKNKKKTWAVTVGNWHRTRQIGGLVGRLPDGPTSVSWWHRRKEIQSIEVAFFFFLPSSGNSNIAPLAKTTRALTPFLLTVLSPTSPDFYDKLFL